MSFVRFLVYSNEYDVEGVVATTSTWQRDATRTDIMDQVIDAYAPVQGNLLKHARGFPAADELRGLVKPGQPGYGLAAIGADKMTPGAQQIIDAADRPDPRPLWVSVWGGANTLAQALLHVRETRTPAELERFVSKLRVYSISDQDDAGQWIRREFPSLFYVVKPSPPDGSEYDTATWTGIGGDRYYLNGDGADFTTVTNEWLEENIRSQGTAGRGVPRVRVHHGGRHPVVPVADRQRAGQSREPELGWMGRTLRLPPALRREPVALDAGRRRLRARVVT
jgi:hypothetical protein